MERMVELKGTVAARNQMGLLGGISYIIGNIVGAGIFITPSTILANTGSVGFSLVIWTFTAGVAALGSFSYIELGTSIRESGCDFAYYCYVGWYPLAFCYIFIMALIHYPAVMAVQAQTFSQYLFTQFKCVSDENVAVARKLVEAALIALLIFINFFSLRRFVARFNIVASVAKVVAATAIIGIGFYFLVVRGHVENFHEPFKGSLWDAKHLVTALFAGLFSYDGWDILNFGAEEITHPRRNLPLSILIGMSVICTIYLCINVAYFTVLTIPQIVANTAVADTFFRATLGAGWSFVMPLAVCVLLVGSINGSLFQSSRLLHSASRGGYLPAFVSCTNEETDSPRAALVVTLVLAFGMNLVADLDVLLNYIGFAQWSQRGLTMLVLFWIRYNSIPTRHSSEIIRAPLIVPIAFFTICASLTVLTIVEDIKAALLGMGVYLLAFIAYMALVYDKALPSIPRYTVVTGRVDSFFTSLLQVGLNTMPQRIKMPSYGAESGVGNGVANGDSADMVRSHKAKGSARRRGIRIIEKSLFPLP